MQNYGVGFKIADDDTYSPMAVCYNKFVHKLTWCCIACVIVSFPFLFSSLSKERLKLMMFSEWCNEKYGA